jgi:hypothetical protein
MQANLGKPSEHMVEDQKYENERGHQKYEGHQKTKVSGPPEKGPDVR